MAKLTAAFVGRVLAGTVPPGRHRDGGGLLLNVRAPGKASWVMRYTLHGKQHDLGLGALDVIGLSEARKLVAQRKLALKANKLDPLAQRAQERAEAAKSRHVRSGGRTLHHRTRGWVEESQASPAMEKHAQGLREPEDRPLAGARD